MSMTPAAAPDPSTPADATTMRAVVQDRYGTAEVLRVEEVAVPTLAEA